jgi:hypothetical protein
MKTDFIAATATQLDRVVDKANVVISLYKDQWVGL